MALNEQNFIALSVIVGGVVGTIVTAHGMRETKQEKKNRQDFRTIAKSFRNLCEAIDTPGATIGDVRRAARDEKKFLYIIVSQEA